MDPPPTPKSLLRWILLGAAALAIAVVALLWSRGPVFVLPADANQNVLLITIDTLRADALGSYGGGAATPNLDRLAAGG
ncbi:MAG TPA: hypothetical protein VFO19_15040, partial [Vicinamibacterales bacterium]|nr:hypothetical protein [Vicinamibacterales bacterium]